MEDDWTTEAQRAWGDMGMLVEVGDHIGQLGLYSSGVSELIGYIDINI